MPGLILVTFLMMAGSEHHPEAWAVVGVGVVVVWLRWVDDGTAERWVALGVRTSWWGWRTYGRWWATAVAAGGLGDDSRAELPYLVAVHRTRTGAVLAVQSVPGHGPDEVQERLAEVGDHLGVARCWVRSVAPGAVWLETRARDAHVVGCQASSLRPRSASADEVAVVVGGRPDAKPWRLPLSAGNTLVVGEPGTGTSCPARAVLAAARPLAQTGAAALWVVDTSGGTVLGDLGPYTRTGFGGPADVARLLDDLRAEVRGRMERLRDRSGPLVIAVIDDVSTALAAAAADVDARARHMRRALNIVLAEGPAVGVVVVAIVKDLDQVAEIRHLFKNRMAFRMADPADTDYVLGRGAARHGAACADIPPPPAGVGIAYAWLHTEPVPTRVDVDCIDQDEHLT